MTELTIDEKFAAEQKQADADHHKPTAGAMTGHIVSNHAYINVKLHQLKWFVKGPNAENYKAVLSDTIDENNAWFDKIADQLLDEGELPPSTMKEYSDYTMIEENGANKYLDAESMIQTVVNDFATDNMFVTRAIKLAQNEDRPFMAQVLVELLGWNNHQIRIYQALLGNDAKAGFEEDDDDDDED
ncbi:ferritin-like domain-containing protein [Companilactobacillus nodensis]|uniref:Ferritin Dps family protein n=1 Tax=Companilactobacillus nodensis DSM 19682 = JCM 14932 = NBRC 107160 TaxID=1423775 RepID=A0A0R1KCP6_9LACO|nr:ferritin-like domain-containing protein [Companilactobacillus nodensis]KRK81232.1 ferritin Dps family protein [Companilactobacillus nodensis DSM 19682 = JCM 14932 = NBRC 107160]